MTATRRIPALRRFAPWGGNRPNQQDRVPSACCGSLKLDSRGITVTYRGDPRTGGIWAHKAPARIWAPTWAALTITTAPAVSSGTWIYGPAITVGVGTISRKIASPIGEKLSVSIPPSATARTLPTAFT